MLVRDIPSSSLPWLQSGDTVADALQLMQDHHCEQLPVVESGVYAGLLTEEELLEHPHPEERLHSLLPLLASPSVSGDHHFLQALTLLTEQQLSVVPVLGEDRELIALLTLPVLVQQLARFLGWQEGGALLVLERESNHYSFSEISKLVETNDAQVTQLNTYNDPQTGIIQITLRVNKPEISDIVATFQRYDYKVCFYAGEEQYTNQLRSNYDHLMHYLKI
jgi:signal-transduction protein with cAMP-binding, CBS, and nucleotidyltransferase domain